MTDQEAINEITRLRNRHVAKLLEYLGDCPPYLESAIKRSYSMFAQDIQHNLIDEHSEHSEDDYGNGNR